MAGLDSWKTLDVFLAKDYYFSRNGVCPCAERDEGLITAMIEGVFEEEIKHREELKKKTRKRKSSDHEIIDIGIVGSFEKYIEK